MCYLWLVAVVHFAENSQGRTSEMTWLHFMLGHYAYGMYDIQRSSLYCVHLAGIQMCIMI